MALPKGAKQYYHPTATQPFCMYDHVLNIFSLDSRHVL